MEIAIGLAVVCVYLLIGSIIAGLVKRFSTMIEGDGEQFLMTVLWLIVVLVAMVIGPVCIISKGLSWVTNFVATYRNKKLS